MPTVNVCRCFILAGVLGGLLAQTSTAGPASAPENEAGTLRIHPDHPHYFQSPSGQPLLLIGDYTWGTFSDLDFDYEALFDSLQARGPNLARVWLWWGCEQFPPPEDKRHVEPFLRPGPGTANDGRPKYDLGRFNPKFFERLRSFCAAARQRDVFLQLITVDAWMLKHKHLWKLHAFHRANNVNGVDGDPRDTGTGIDGQQGFCSLGNPQVLEFQKAYLRRLVETLKDVDHVLIEIANENYYSADWERHLCEYIRTVERTQGHQHVLMPLDLLSHSSVVQKWDPQIIRAALLEKRALRQPLIFDTDWIINNNDDQVRSAMWTAVLSGAHFNYMDDSLEFRAQPEPDRRATLHDQIGHLAAFMKLLKPWQMLPDNAPLKEGNAFVLTSETDLAAYLPKGASVTLDLSDRADPLAARWFNPRDGKFSNTFTVSGGQAEAFQAPTRDDWALLLKRSNPIAR